MSTDLERELRKALHEDAHRARLVNPDGAPATEPRDLAATHDRRWSMRTLAVAAAVFALVALVAAVTRLDDDQVVDTTPATTLPEPGPGPEPEPRPLPDPTVQKLGGRTISSGSGCPFGISGDPVDVRPGPAGGRFDTDPGQGVAHILLGSQTAEVRVPGFQLTTEGWRIEPIGLGGRSAAVWLDGPASGEANLPFVQVRYFPGTDEPCSSFTVTVDGGTEETNRATAVDLAERMLLPADLQDLDLPGAEGGPVAGLQLPGTTWAVTVPSHPTEGGEMYFGTTVRWTDGCATLTADYELDRDDGILTLSNVTSTDPGCTPPTHPEFTLGWPTITSVMGSERIPASLVNGRLYLGEYNGENVAGETLVLGPPS